MANRQHHASRSGVESVPPKRRRHARTASRHDNDVSDVDDDNEFFDSILDAESESCEVAV